MTEAAPTASIPSTAMSATQLPSSTTALASITASTSASPPSEQPPLTIARAPRDLGGGAFTIPLICIGIGIIAMCLLIPATDENRQVAYEKARLAADLAQMKKQVATNDAFLKRIGDDPTLSERLARRQLKMVPEGTAVLDLKSTQKSAEMSPFLLVTVPPPAAFPPYRPVGGFLAAACRHPKTQLYLIGASLLMIASGLVLSRSGSALENADADFDY